MTPYLKTTFLMHDWRGVNHEHPIVHNVIGTVHFYTLNNTLLRVRRVRESPRHLLCVDEWYLANRKLNMNALFPSLPSASVSSAERLPERELRFILAKVLFQEMGKIVEERIDQIMAGED